MRKLHIWSANLHHRKSCFQFVYNFKRKLSYSFIHFDNQIVSKKHSSDVFVHKNFQSIHLQENYVFQKKRERALLKCKSFLHNKFFEGKVPRESEKQLLSRPIRTQNSVFFFQNVSKLHANFWTRKFYCWHRFLWKRSPLHYKWFPSFCKTFTWFWKPRLLWRRKLRLFFGVFQNVIFQA